MQLVWHEILKSTLKDYEDKNMGYNKYLLFASMFGGCCRVLESLYFYHIFMETTLHKKKQPKI